MSGLDAVIERIEKARLRVDRRRIVKLIAVSKYVDKEQIRWLHGCGQRAFGESRVQDLKAKGDALLELPIEWHFIGRLQTNKINALIDLSPTLFHSLDSFQAAQELDKRLAAKGKKLSALLQINSAKEQSKAGVMPEIAADEYLKTIDSCKNIELCGVMSIGAHEEDAEVVKKSFQVSAKIFEQLKPHGARHCSMGMSGDFELAIECGSNMVRIGSMLFSQ